MCINKKSLWYKVADLIDCGNKYNPAVCASVLLWWWWLFAMPAMTYVDVVICGSLALVQHWMFWKSNTDPGEL